MGFWVELSLDRTTSDSPTDRDAPRLPLKRWKFETVVIGRDLATYFLPLISTPARHLPAVYQHLTEPQPPPLPDTPIVAHRTHVDAGILEIPTSLLSSYVNELLALVRDPPWPLMKAYRSDLSRFERMHEALESLAWFVASCQGHRGPVIVEIETRT